MRKRFSISRDSKVIGIVGRISAIKNHALFIESALSFNRRFPNEDVIFVVVGDGESDFVNSLKKMALSNTKIIFTGTINEAESIYGLLDMLVLTSKNEGTPVTLIEAQASNKPIVRNGSKMSKSSNIKLTYGREHLAIPGPSNIPQRVLQAMNRPAPNIYGKEIELVTEGVREGIAKFANTNGKTIIYVSNGHGVWEASLVNLFRPNDSVFLCSTGHFGYKWGIIAKRLGLNIIHIDVGFNTIIDPTQIEEILKNDRAQKIKGILAVHTDTSSSSRNRIQDFKEAISAAKHPAILVVDAIASFGCERIEMDPWGIDVLITASQKGLMTPPGLAYCIVNERAENYSKKLNKKDQIVSPYWDWQPRLNPARFYDIFSGTAPTNLLFGQLEALNMLNEEGI